MNTKNNKRRQATRESIEKVFIELLQENEISQITVSDICKLTGFNRSTFYANYLDIYDLADKIRDRLESEVDALNINDMIFAENGYLNLFRHIKDNRLFYITYFKLGYDSRHSVDLSAVASNREWAPKENLEYHVEFHKAGLNAIIKKWLASGCKESPESMAKIVQDEYKKR